MLRSVTQTLAPSVANRIAMASPIPEPAPVTMATCPSKRAIGSDPFACARWPFYIEAHKLLRLAERGGPRQPELGSWAAQEGALAFGEIDPVGRGGGGHGCQQRAAGYGSPVDEKRRVAGRRSR